MKKKDKNKPVTEPELQEAEPLEPEVSDAPAEEEHVATAEEWQAALELAVKQRDEFKDSLLRAQADFYAAIMDILKAHADQVDGVQVWGILDSQSWRSKNHPLLFDGDGQPKYAFWALTDPSRIPQ
jgi:hypothetical protein